MEVLCSQGLGAPKAFEVFATANETAGARPHLSRQEVVKTYVHRTLHSIGALLGGRNNSTHLYRRRSRVTRLDGMQGRFLAKHIPEHPYFLQTSRKNTQVGSDDQGECPRDREQSVFLRCLSPTLGRLSV